MIYIESISVIIPAYNEEKCIGNLIRKFNKVMENKKYEIIVVDDGSTDKTAEIAEKNKARVIKHSYNKGYGAALKTGIKSSKYNSILIIDADGSYNVSDIPKLLLFIKDYDMIVGVRKIKLGTVPLKIIIGQKIIILVAELLNWKKIPDLNSGMRVFKKKIFKKNYKLFPEGFSFTSTLTMICLNKKYRIKYVPINYHKRKGTSKLKFFIDGSKIFFHILNVMVFLNPIKFLFTMNFIFGIIIISIKCL